MDYVQLDSIIIEHGHLLGSFELASNFSNAPNKADIPRVSHLPAQQKFLFQPSGRDKPSIKSKGRSRYQSRDSCMGGVDNRLPLRDFSKVSLYRLLQNVFLCHDWLSLSHKLEFTQMLATKSV